MDVLCRHCAVRATLTAVKPLGAILTSGSRLAGHGKLLLIQLSRMFRGPRILTRSCPIRSLLLPRDSHLSARSAWQDVRHARRRTSEEEPSLSFTTQHPSFTSDCDYYKLKKVSFQNLLPEAILSSRLQSSQIYAPAKAKQPPNLWKCAAVEDLDRNTKAGCTYYDCLANTSFRRSWRRPWDFCRTLFSFTRKTRCDLVQGHLYYKRHSVRPFSLSTPRPWIFTHIHCRPQTPIFSLPQIRAVHRAAPRMTATWSDCLSPENENRCRQDLGPNLKLYEVEKGSRGVSQSQAKNQRRCASILVSLCSADREPAFLFTLRSSKLKGRHKGDVSFAGGKSDPSDRDVVATALREAREELGINVATERVWGVLKPLRDAVSRTVLSYTDFVEGSGMMIAPVLANLGPLEELTFKPNPGEVDEIFTLSLSHLCNPQNRGYTHFRTGDKYGFTLPVFRNGKHRVWGLTAVALDHTLKLIVPP